MLASREGCSIARVGSNDIGPILMVLVVVAFVLYRFIGKSRAGAGASHHDEWRREFGFGPDEQLTHAWFGVMYTGPLRPDVDYSTLRVNPHIFALGSAEPWGKPENTGRVCRVALSDRGSLGVSIEVSDDSDAADQVRALTSAGSGMLALQRFGPAPRPAISSAQAAFGSVSGWQGQLGEAPRMRGSSGGLVTYELVHIVGPELPAGVTVWLDPDGVRHLERWSGAGREMQARAS